MPRPTSAHNMLAAVRWRIRSTTNRAVASVSNLPKPPLSRNKTKNKDHSKLTGTLCPCKVCLWAVSGLYVPVGNTLVSLVQQRDESLCGKLTTPLELWKQLLNSQQPNLLLTEFPPACALVPTVLKVKPVQVKFKTYMDMAESVALRPSMSEVALEQLTKKVMLCGEGKSAAVQRLREYVARGLTRLAYDKYMCVYRVSLVCR